MPNSSAIFRSDLQEKVLRNMCADPTPRSATDIAASLHAPVSTVARETSRLAEAGLLVAKPAGRRTLLSADLRNPYMRAAKQAFADDDMLNANVTVGIAPPRISQIAEAMRVELAAGDEAMALRLMLDGVNRIPTTPTDALDQMLDEPATIGDQRWDTLLAACVQYYCRRIGIRAPAWSRKEPLESWWWPAREHARAAMTMQRTPIDFKRLGIWFSERNFTTA